MKKIAVLLTLVFLLIARSSLIKAIENTPTTPPFAPNEVIIRYKEGQSPEELKIKVAQRESLRHSFLIGPIRLFFENLKLRLTGQDTPEKKLSRLQAADQKVGVISVETLFQNTQDPTLKNFYLLKTDGRLEVPKAVELYKKLPEVETAEPNYTYQMMGI